MTTHALSRPVGSWRNAVEHAARTFAAITLAGALGGVLVGGVGGRLAMMLLARMNPGATGVTTDDGFAIGQLTLSGTLQLLGAGLQMGLVGAAVYAGLRWLMIGPRWFQCLSLSAGAGVVVGTALVHTDGVDFLLLQPAWLAIALFVLIPGLYVLLLTLLAERWLGPDGWPRRAGLWVAVSPLLLWAAMPLLPLVVAGWLLYQVATRTPRVRDVVAHPAVPWLFRGALTVIFVLALSDLAAKAAFLA